MLPAVYLVAEYQCNRSERLLPRKFGRMLNFITQCDLVYFSMTHQVSGTSIIRRICSSGHRCVHRPTSLLTRIYLLLSVIGRHRGFEFRKWRLQERIRASERDLWISGMHAAIQYRTRLNDRLHAGCAQLAQRSAVKGSVIRSEHYFLIGTCSCFCFGLRWIHMTSWTVVNKCECKILIIR